MCVSHIHESYTHYHNCVCITIIWIIYSFICMCDTHMYVWYTHKCVIMSIWFIYVWHTHINHMTEYVIHICATMCVIHTHNHMNEYMIHIIVIHTQLRHIWVKSLIYSFIWRDSSSRHESRHERVYESYNVISLAPLLVTPYSYDLCTSTSRRAYTTQVSIWVR